MHITGKWTLFPATLGAMLALLAGVAPASAGQKSAEDAMSAMGRLAARARAAVEATGGALAAPVAPNIIGVANRDLFNDELCTNDIRCPGGLREGPDGTQSEMSIAIDTTGQHVVVGFNDFRGFSTNPLSVSGYMYSSDGGKTFTDGGQLPVTTGISAIGATQLPQISGDPEIKYLGGCTFVYASIVVARFGASSTVQTMGVHRSTDCGVTWQGPYVVTPASNPGGLTTAAGAPRDAADKEFMDVDPDTGRLIMTWTNFGATAVEIRSALSDDGGLTWGNGALIAATDADGQASIPRFARGNNNVYVAWRRFPFPGTLFGYGNSVGFARSVDNGLTWQTAVDLSPEFLTQDLILGNDRSNTSPSLAVDISNSRYAGNVYVIYPNNDSNDGSDIAFQKSSDGGRTFSEPMLINARPGADRAQWFPWVTVDTRTGKITVFYYDQGVATSGDLTEVSYLTSSDGGETWSHPRPLTARPFNAGHGNDTSQPNLGDYVQAVANGGITYFAYAISSPPPGGFTDGQPNAAMTVPDARVTVLDAFTPRHTPVSLGEVTVTAPGGYVDPNERFTVRLPLFNYATNPLYAATIRNATAQLKSATPNVFVQERSVRYGRIEPGETVAGPAFNVWVDSRFVPGTPIELELEVNGAPGTATLRYTVLTGTPVATPVLTQNFDGAAPGTLPAGWTVAHGGGAVTVPWTTSATFCGTSNKAYHESTVGTRFERLFSPAFVVPANAQYVTVEFDVCYNTEDDPVLPVTGYDGFLLRVTDLTTGRTLRSVLAEAFATEFTTGAIKHYPKHFPRSSNTAYFQDMSAWAGDSGGVQHVRMRFPGMAGSTAQLRFEFTQDSVATCTDVRPGTVCGVSVDNVSVNSVVSAAPTFP